MEKTDTVTCTQGCEIEPGATYYYCTSCERYYCESCFQPLTLDGGLWGNCPRCGEDSQGETRLAPK